MERADRLHDRNDYIGGRVFHTNFGTKRDGSYHTVEIGANWIHGRKLGSDDNPMWKLAEKHNIATNLCDDDDLMSYDEHGESDYCETLQPELARAQDKAEELAQWLRGNDFPDISLRAALRLGGWDPRHDPHKQAVEFYDLSYTNAVYPERCSLLADAEDCSESPKAPTAFYGDERLVQDARGYNHIVCEEAKLILKDEDPRLLLNTVVTKIEYSDKGVRIRTSDNVCIAAEHAICTFSIGVLQHDNFLFEPALSMRKQLAINAMEMGVYTKIFFEFPERFWPRDVENFLWADPVDKGSFAWRSFDCKGFQPGSNIIIATVVGDSAERMDSQTDDEIKSSMVQVLRKMFPTKVVPEPVAFLYPRWTKMPWVRGSYSSTPVGFSESMLAALRENAGRPWFAGEALSDYRATVHGAWLYGKRIGQEVGMLCSM